MNTNKPNHECLICGEKYYACDSCDEVRKIAPYRAIVDTSNHYHIHLIVNDFYFGNITKAVAKKKLSKCDLTGKENFKPNVLEQINKILGLEETKKADVEEKVKEEVLVETDELQEVDEPNDSQVESDPQEEIEVDENENELDTIK